MSEIPNCYFTKWWILFKIIGRPITTTNVCCSFLMLAKENSSIPCLLEQLLLLVSTYFSHLLKQQTYFKKNDVLHRQNLYAARCRNGKQTFLIPANLHHLLVPSLQYPSVDCNVLWRSSISFYAERLVWPQMNAGLSHNVNPWKVFSIRNWSLVSFFLTSMIGIYMYFLFLAVPAHIHTWDVGNSLP